MKAKHSIVVHGIIDWFPTQKDFLDMYGTRQFRSQQDCMVSIGKETKTIKEWHHDLYMFEKVENAI